jgi:hypothetical protein
MQPTKVTERIKAKALELLEQHPEGLRYSGLHAKILEADGTFNRPLKTPSPARPMAATI